MKIYIAEDEPLAAAKLKLFLEKLGEGPDISLFDNGVSALAALQREAPDVLFLDIQMPGMNGMEVLGNIQTGTTQVIITSAYDEYALPAFSFHVADYLLKPYTLERLQTALAKVKETLRLKQLDQQVNAATISIRCDGRDEVIHVADILSLESLKDYVRLSLRNGQRRTFLGSLTSFEKQLPDDFVRIHRSFIVNKKAVVASDSSEVTLSNGDKFPIGKTYKAIFR